jgi:predicted transcriptional regulator
MNTLKKGHKAFDFDHCRARLVTHRRVARELGVDRGTVRKYARGENDSKPAKTIAGKRREAAGSILEDGV